MHELRDRTIVITGAAGLVGAELTDQLLAAGARVFALHRRPPADAERLAAAARRADGRVRAVQLDLADEPALLAFGRSLEAENVGVDGLVNLAGEVPHGAVADATFAEWERAMTVNVASQAVLIRAVLPQLRPGASIVNVGSGVALAGMAERSSYGASKAAVLGLTRALSRELGPRGVRVNYLAPGVIDSDELSDAQRSRHAGRISLGRFVTPAEVAVAIAFLLSPAASGITGATLAVDCGM